MLNRMLLSKRATQPSLRVGGGLLVAVAVAMPLLVEIDPELTYLSATEPLPRLLLYTIAGMGTACWHSALRYTSWQTVANTVSRSHLDRHHRVGGAGADWRPVAHDRRDCGTHILRLCHDLRIPLGEAFQARPHGIPDASSCRVAEAGRTQGRRWSDVDQQRPRKNVIEPTPTAVQNEMVAKSRSE